MTFSDIKNKIYFLTKTNSASFTDAQLTVEANNALDRVASLIMGADGRWEFDDTNQTDLPIATTGLVTDQSDYALPTSHLEITRVEFKPSGQTYFLQLQPVDLRDFEGTTLSATFPTSMSLPQYYDKLGNSLFLYAAPNYTQAASLKVYFKRPPSYFVSSDTTKTPGFNSLYHDLIPLWAAYNYAIAHGLTNANQIFVEIDRKEKSLIAEYSRRDKDDLSQITIRRIRHR
jgi:hypothetical protein